jgi:hypothetical protein
MNIIQASWWAKSGATQAARIYGNAGTPITQATISSITCKVFDKNVSVETPVLTPSITVSSVVFDTLQDDDPRWTIDETGYNFLHAIAATAFPTNNHIYRIEYIFTPTSGAVFPLVYEGKAEAIFSLP